MYDETKYLKTFITKSHQNVENKEDEDKNDKYW